MTVTIDLPPQVEQVYRELAAVQGVPLHALVRDVVSTLTAVFNCRPVSTPTSFCARVTQNITIPT